jgi:NAD-dependent deacetylase
MPKQNIIFFTGAGISKESGIPTFDEQPGIRNKLYRDFANERPEEYREVIQEMIDICEKAEPNAAHKAIADLGCPVITMNVDRLHTRAGSKDVVEVHGVLPNPVLYGDPAPEYYTAEDRMNDLVGDNCVFVIVGTSFYTHIANRLRWVAEHWGARVLTINSDATTRVPELCEFLKTVSWRTVDIHAVDFSRWED